MTTLVPNIAELTKVVPQKHEDAHAIVSAFYANNIDEARENLRNVLNEWESALSAEKIGDSE
ncbi:hypothetical protein I3U30_08775 [Mycobacteroides abscessus subsp. massiliense]|uniref:hypothetical protein n=1 Tax=Mycobacteroides abscessus TaxID=36809 RepID=UPI0010086706|nr:hypothetical protein [Mycobacteroides abscessus]QSM76841.1 hypothetical protein I2T84_09345 [Mycobacteroides abscessus subsp. massiliense]QSN60108.1 hypothetical protein I3U30_08775 [Mycobacteroides abscessus subsp. massiliense]